PCTLQCGPIVVPSPISTPGPIQVNAPTDTPSPSRADGSTTAVGWMSAAMSGAHLGAEDVGAGHLLAVDARHAAVQGHVADLALDLDLEVEPVAGHHHARELRVVHLDQVRQPALETAAVGELGQHAAGLGQGLDHQHPGHHRAVREVAGEERLVGADVLVAEHALARLGLDHAVDQQERVAVRQHLADARDVDGERDLLLHPVSFGDVPTRRARASSCLTRTALRRQLRLSISGVPEESSPGSRIEWVTRLIAVTTTRSQISRWPAIPAAPPIMQYRPIVV